jgi:hypothetical protein
MKLDLTFAWIDVTSMVVLILPLVRPLARLAILARTLGGHSSYTSTLFVIFSVSIILTCSTDQINQFNSRLFESRTAIPIILFRT